MSKFIPSPATTLYDILFGGWSISHQFEQVTPADTAGVARALGFDTDVHAVRAAWSEFDADLDDSRPGSKIWMFGATGFEGVADAETQFNDSDVIDQDDVLEYMRLDPHAHVDAACHHFAATDHQAHVQAYEWENDYIPF